jgi:hypothetical protein
MNQLIGKTINHVSLLTHYSNHSIPETAPLLEMTDGTRYFFNGYTWEQIKNTHTHTHVNTNANTNPNTNANANTNANTNAN